jgi:hypothetical protein
MANIQIGVINPEETEKVTMQVPNDVPVRDVTEAIVELMKLPPQEQYGELLRYWLNRREPDGHLERLQDNLTLGENRVQGGDVLQLLDSFDKQSRPAQLEKHMSEQRLAQVFLARRLMAPAEENSLLAQRLSRLEQELEKVRADIGDMKRSGVASYPPDDFSEEMEDLYKECSSAIRYFDFDITFSGSISECHAEALWSDGGERLQGECRFEMPISLNELEFDYLRNMGLVSRSSGFAHRLAKELGQKLFQTVFAETIRDRFRECQSRAESEGHGVRIRLNLKDASELINYPWELLCDEEDRGFLATNDYTPVVRYVPGGAPKSRKENPPLKMLVVTASPSGHVPLNIEQEKENLLQALRNLVMTNLLKIEWLDHATPTKLLRALRKNRALHILHYIGHGDVSTPDGGYLVLEGDAGASAAQVDVPRLSALLGNCRQVKLITLNTCRGARTTASDPFAGVAMGLLRYARVPVVVAMQHEIHDQTAIKFSEIFYKYLAAGCSVYLAISGVRMALYIQNLGIEWAIPVLYSRSPEGVIFKRSKPAEQ